MASLSDFLDNFSPLNSEPEISAAAYEEPLEWFVNAGLGGVGDVLLHGAGEGSARFSAAVAAPSFVLSVAENVATFWADGATKRFKATPMEVLGQLDGFMERNRRKTGLGFFSGGLVCLLSYELNRCFENVQNHKPTLGPDLWCAFYPNARLFDSVEKKAYDVSWLPRKSKSANVISDHGFEASPFVCDESKAVYKEKIKAVKSLITKGDVYQVNLSRLLAARFSGSPLGYYSSLAEKNTAEYGAFLNGGDFQLLSLSPELFFSLREGRITTRPIKGTAPRSPDAAKDAALRRGLIESEKNLAENLMIVDLMRSDLGRICKPGTIRVDELFKCESLPTVHHLVSTVSGELAQNCGLGRILSALWPGGSVTGAPKVRAMEIIAELETTSRGPYCGSLAACGLDGGIDASLLIRTLFLSGGAAKYRTGGGITADSDPDEEFEETVVKAAVLNNINMAVRA